MTDTSGFYRIDPNGDFQYAPNFVFAPDYSLYRDMHEQYTYPTQGNWFWFESELEAKDHFGIPYEVDSQDELDSNQE